jgi:hypothetical protein
MTNDDIDKIWGQAMDKSIKNGEAFTRYRFANLVAAHKAEVITAEAYRCGHEVAAELRRLHKVNQELLEALETIRDLYEYETSCGELASRLYDARNISIFAIANSAAPAAEGM